MSTPQINSIGDKAIEMRLTTVKEAMQRSRFVFIVMTIASSAIIFALWNDRFARDKDLAFSTPSYSEAEVKSNRPPPIHTYGRQQLVAEWYKNRIIQITVLGVRLSVSDLAITGSFTLAIITIWYYYSQRRENRATVTLLRDARQESVKVRNLIYQVIKHSSVFIKTEPSNEPLEGLSPSQDVSAGISNEAAGGEGSAAPDKTNGQAETTTDKALRFLTFLPFWTIIAIIGRDVAAMFMQSPTSGTDSTLSSILLRQAREGGFTWASTYPLFYVLIFDTVAVILAVYTFKLCKRSREFSLATRKTLMQFEDVLERDKSEL